MPNSTEGQLYKRAYEYYYDYCDPVIVDESQLKYSKYSILIIFWITLLAFVGFLFIILTLMSRNGNPPRARTYRNTQRTFAA